MTERMQTTIVVGHDGMLIEHGRASGDLYAQSDNWDCYVVKKKGASVAGKYSTIQYVICLAASELGIRQLSVRMVR